MRQLHRKLSERGDVEILVIEQKEPHCGRMAFAEIEQPATFEERRSLARRCKEELELPLTFLVDGMDDASRALFGDLPSPAFIIDATGILRDKLPWADPEAIEKSLEHLDSDSASPAPPSDLRAALAQARATLRQADQTAASPSTEAPSSSTAAPVHSAEAGAPSTKPGIRSVEAAPCTGAAASSTGVAASSKEAILAAVRSLEAALAGTTASLPEQAEGRLVLASLLQHSDPERAEAAASAAAAAARKAWSNDPARLVAALTELALLEAPPASRLSRWRSALAALEPRAPAALRSWLEHELAKAERAVKE